MENRFAQRVYLAAEVTGIGQLAPLYFAEGWVSRTQPPAMTHPDFYYGFRGVALAWQIAFIIMAREPWRYRPLLPALVLEKALYPVGTWVLYAIGRLQSTLTLAAASSDFLWLALFVIANVGEPGQTTCKVDPCTRS